LALLRKGHAALQAIREPLKNSPGGIQCG
jgi:hypothetical protein